MYVKPMEPWQARVIDERTELAGRLARLERFLCSPPLLDGQSSLLLLRIQAAAMQAYLHALDGRIDLFDLDPALVEAYRNSQPDGPPGLATSLEKIEVKEMTAKELAEAMAARDMGGL